MASPNARLRRTRRRPKLPPVSEQMRAWAAALAAEVKAWPQVSARSFFGFTALYRRSQIFALLPRTRGMEFPDALAFKLEKPASKDRRRLSDDIRVGQTKMGSGRWYTFTIREDGDLRDAAEWLQIAHEGIKRRPIAKRPHRNQL